MKPKYKMTGCARFMIFLLILIPIAYFGSKYLRDSGTWDKIKDKVENNDPNSVERTIDNNADRLDPVSTDDLNADERYGRLRRAYDQQELVIQKQEQTIRDLHNQIDKLKNNQPAQRDQATIPAQRTEEPRRPTSSTNTGSPSLDDLLNEADGNLGSPGSSNDTRSTNTAVKKTIGRWTFSYSGVRGDLEFYQQNDKLLSRITVDGDNRVTIDEIRKSGDRFNVVGSQTGEYYILKNNGDLDAYDRNGYQTTCTYVR